MANRSAADRGFTIVELLVVVVILGITFAIAVPRMTRDNTAAVGRRFAQDVAQELQRARVEAISTRRPRYAFVYSDRIEIRSAKPGATPTAPLVAPTAADPALRTIVAAPGVTAMTVQTTTSSPSLTLSPSVSKEVVFTTLGAGFLAPAPPAIPGPVYLFIQNDGSPANHPDRRFRVDVAALTGFVALRSNW